MSTIYPIPDGYFCVPSALIALTGASPDAVIVPAINRHAKARDLLEAPAGVNVERVAEAVLAELGYTVRRYKRDATAGKLSARVSTWASRSLRYPGRPVLITTRGDRKSPGHCLVVCDGQIYDNHIPAGAAPTEHPFSTAIVSYAALVEKR